MSWLPRGGGEPGGRALYPIRKIDSEFVPGLPRKGVRFRTYGVIVLGPAKAWLSRVNRSNHLPVNFALALPAKQALERLRSEIDARYPEDPVAVLSIAWGYPPGVDPLSGHVVIGFYPRSLMADVAHGVQEVSGVRLVFAVSEEFHPLFAGKVLDHEAARGFFLRDP